MLGGLQSVLAARHSVSANQAFAENSPMGLLGKQSRVVHFEPEAKIIPEVSLKTRRYKQKSLRTGNLSKPVLYEPGARAQCLVGRSSPGIEVGVSARRGLFLEM